MKRILLCSLFGIGLLFGMSGKLSAAAVAEPSATFATDTVEIIEPSAAEIRIDSLLKILDGRLSGLEQEVQQLKDRQSAHREPWMKSEYLPAIFILLISCSTLVSIVFFILRFRYLCRKERYDCDRFAIERGCYSELQDKRPRLLTRFIGKLLIVSIIGFCLLALISIVNMSYISFFTVLLLWVLLGSVGYAVFYLFRLYVQRCDENR